MAVYEYRAIGTSGRAVKGVIDADSPALARRKLRERDLHPTHLAEAAAAAAEGPGKLSFSRVSSRDVAVMTRQLAVLLQAGTALVESLSVLIKQTANPRLAKIIYDVRDRVNEGASFADALAGHPRVFSALYKNMVRAGETSGALEQVLFRLSDLQERQVRLQKRIVASLVYPVFMVCFSLAVIVLLMSIVVPKVVQVFMKQEMELPAPTKVLIFACDAINAYWWALLGGVLIVLVLWRLWVSRPGGRRTWDALKLRSPLVGKLYLKIMAARFSRTLGTMLHGGLTMMTALDVVKTVVQNRVVEEVLDDVKSDVRRGRDLSVPLQESALFPPMLVHMAELGQRSGELEAMLLRVADTYEEDVELTIEALVGLVQPAVIVLLGGFVGFLVMAILLPIFRMSSGV